MNAENSAEKGILEFPPPPRRVDIIIVISPYTHNSAATRLQRASTHLIIIHRLNKISISISKHLIYFSFSLYILQLLLLFFLEIFDRDKEAKRSRGVFFRIAVDCRIDCASSSSLNYRQTFSPWTLLAGSFLSSLSDFTNSMMIPTKKIFLCLRNKKRSKHDKESVERISLALVWIGIIENIKTILDFTILMMWCWGKYFINSIKLSAQLITDKIEAETERELSTSMECVQRNLISAWRRKKRCRR